MRNLLAAVVLMLGLFTTAVAADFTIGQKFASIADGHFHARDSPEAKDASQLLQAAAKKFRSSPETIADLVVIGYNESQKQHFRYSMYEVAEALPVMDPLETSTEDHAKQIMVMYLTARNSGMNHSEAVVGIRRMAQIANP